MNLPQLILIVLQSLGLGIGMTKHGKDSVGKENFWVTLASVSLLHVILWWGGWYG